MSLIIDKNKDGNYNVFLNKNYTTTYTASNIKEAIMQFQEEINYLCDELLARRNICKVCNDSCGYMQYVPESEQFYCPTCEEKKGK